MDILLINSMSRTGTSLLYQLLYGHPAIYFAPYRIQFVCSPPYGFPILGSSNENPFGVLLGKTTLPVDVSENTRWHNAKLKWLTEVIGADNYNELRNTWDQHNDQHLLERAVLCLDRAVGATCGNSRKYVCLHDDHSYLMGSHAIANTPVKKVLTTVRHPLDMVASKKNMLFFHVFQSGSPASRVLREDVLRREAIRSVYSMLIASYEYSHDSAYYPLLFEHLRSPQRAVVMKGLADYLGIAEHPCLLSDSNEIVPGLMQNELLFAGSSLKQLTQGKTDVRVGASGVSLTQDEVTVVNNVVDMSFFNRHVEAVPADFYAKFGSLWKEFDLSIQPEFESWFKMYVQGENEHVFQLYSSYNYGRSNANDVFA